MEMKLRGSYTLRTEDSHENWPHTLPSDGRMDVSISGVHGTLAGRREGGDMVGTVGAWHPLHTPAWREDEVIAASPWVSITSQT